MAKRGCGYKKEGGYYLEAEMAPLGLLNLWTWLLGTGTMAGDNLLVTVPARSGIIGNMPGSLLLGEYTELKYPSLGRSAELYEDLVHRTVMNSSEPWAWFDHVGSSFYTALSFAEEVREMGPSRRVSEKTAKQLAAMAPMPIVFTHSRVPLFESEQMLKIGLEMALMCHQGTLLLGEPMELDDYVRLPTWADTRWGMTRSYEYGGQESALIPILRLLGLLDKHYHQYEHDPVWREAKTFYDRLVYREATFGASWITAISYVARKDDDREKVAARLARDGIRVIELEEEAR